HRSDDVHERKLGERCVDCHSPEGWSRWEFDHGARTRFALDGAHTGIDCRACHIVPGETVSKPRKQCVACHEADDAHAGAFGASCERCHETTSFTAVIKPAR
ncbi:MAG: cytochrome c3 family protein, partial [Armatimonadota bacterium]